MSDATVFLLVEPVKEAVRVLTRLADALRPAISAVTEAQRQRADAAHRAAAAAERQAAAAERQATAREAQAANLSATVLELRPVWQAAAASLGLKH